MEKSESFNVSKAVKDYSSSVEELEKITTEITKTASDGRPISEELRSKLNKELDGLKTHYTNLCEKAHKISKDIPENPSIYDLQKIIEEYDKISSELSEIKEILTKFIRVTSNDNEYKEALRPFQNKACEIIEKINNKTADKKIVSSEICKGAGCFIEALNVPSYKNINKETRHSLQNIFDTTVISGLAAGEYFDPQISTENKQSKPAQEPDAEPEPAQTEEPNAIDETPEDNTTAEETDSALTSNQPTINEAKSENNQQPIILTSENKIRKKDKPGSKFVKELRNKKTQNLSHMLILSLLTYFGALTDIQAKKFSDIFQFSFDFFKLPIPLKLIQIAFSDLTKKDNACLISTFILTTTKERVYCLTKYTLDGFNSNPIKNLKKEFGAALQDMPLGNSKFFTDETIEEEILIDQKEKNDSLLDLLERIKDQDYLKSILSDKDFAQNPYYLLENSNETFFSPTVETTKQHEISEPEPNKPEAEQTSAQEQPKQSEPVQIEPIKSEEEIPAKQDETEPKKQAEPAEQTESESPVSEIPQPEDSIKEENIEEESTVEDSPKEKEISNADTATQETEPEQTENRDDALTTICKLIKSNKIYCATAYAKAIKNPFYDVLAYAVDDPMDECDYLSDNIQKLIPVTEEERDFTEPLIVSAAMRTFFSAHNIYDYNLRPLYTTIHKFETVDSNPNLKNAIYKLCKFKEKHHTGLDSYISQNNPSFDNKLKVLKKEAENTIELIKKSTSKIYDPKLLETKKLLFDQNGNLFKFLESVKCNNKGKKQEISVFLTENFIKENYSSENMDNLIVNQKIQKYIDQVWDKAGTDRPLVGDPRNILINELKKCITILIKWVLLIEEMPVESDTGIQNLQKDLKSDLQAADNEIKESLEQHKNDIKKYAGLKIVERTVADIKESIEENTSIENREKYFYVDFLKTQHVLLDENYLPFLDSFPSDPSSLLPETRIMEHSQNADDNSPVDKRLGNIADDYGSAELIFKYLKDIKHEPEDADSIQKCINTGKRNAKKAAEEKKEDFTGELELAFAYGQLDISTEDEILNAVNNYSGKYMKDNNYGFFDRVLKSYREDIKAKAEIRKTVITEQVATFKEKINDEMSVEEQQKIISQIEDFIHQGNYTVVESLLANPKIISEDSGNTSNEDFLKTFIDNYKSYRDPIAKNEPFWTLIKQSITSSDNTKDILEMAQSWFPSAADDNIGEKKLKTLLEHLGFNEINIESTEQTKAGKQTYESYTVKSKKYTIFLHPIAALGSEMMIKDIRIVCIRKNMNAAQILDTITQIGKDKQHTIILLDCALSLTDRRHLAKISKAELGNKLFAVIDRTVMMFMALHYDNTKMNRMLMALTMPFTYYQPYACNSENPIPPEMFIGRKEELDLIKAQNRVNIVYGGRQLGKSALLARAAWDINNNEKGGKAVLITIKNDDYKDTAKKIYKELINSEILSKNSIENTGDWKELADAIKQKLNDSKEISYLLLLLDEADKFIRTCEEVNFAPLDALADIQKTGKFKFVIAGLRDIVKFNRERVTGNNTILSHLESMTVKPFTASEAKELLEIPLRYLGLRFAKGQEYLIYLILANTNYFPGLIQMYCAKLLEAMKKEKYAGYKEAATPPYEISKEHIKKALSDKEFKKDIFQKFEITLGLTDEDNEYYYIIALIIAHLHHERNNSSGYSPEDIIACGKDLEIEKIAEMKTKELEVLLDELTELNILRNTIDNHYMFTRYNFFQMLGKKSDIENKLYKYI